MIDTGNTAVVLLESSVAKPVLSVLSAGLSGQISNTIACLVALHDIGKCHPYFQMKADNPELLQPMFENGLLFRNELKPPVFRHEKESECLIKALLAGRMQNRRAVYYFSRIAALHHQPLHSSHTEFVNRNRYRAWDEQQRLLMDTVCDVFKPDWRILDDCGDFDACCTAVWGLMMLADWLASGQEAFQIPEEAGHLLYAEKSLAAAKAAVLAAGLGEGLALPDIGLYGLFPEIPAGRARPVQAVCESLRISWSLAGDYPLMTLVEAPMGEGKTEAALSLAAALMAGWQKTGIYFALPTAATSNCMFDRVSQCLSSHGIEGSRLMHGHAWLVEQAGMSPGASEMAQSWLAPMRRAMISPYGVGTVDQAMMAVLRIRYTILRLLGMTGKVLIIDEVHAYDAYMQQTLYTLMAWAKALRIPVILLSATLPSQKRRQLFEAAGFSWPDEAPDAYPLVTSGFSDGRVEAASVQSTYMRQTAALDCKPWMDSPQTIAEFALAKAASGGCVGVIVNTVREAQDLYAEIEKQNRSEIPVYLFHARYPLHLRQDIENACVSLFGKNGQRPDSAILIATQVVEQSIDLDFDFLISMLCPIDLLLQRMGRMHRHDRARPRGMEQPGVLVLTPRTEADIITQPSGFVYAPWILKKTWQNIRGLAEIRLPEDIRVLVEQTYAAAEDGDSDFVDWAEMTFRDETLQEHARSYSFPRPDQNSFFMFEGDTVFPGDEEYGAVVRGASTRFDDGRTVQMVFVCEEELNQAAALSVSQEKELLRKSASVPRSWLKDESIRRAEGQGRLRGVTLVLSDGNVCEGLKHRLRMDSKLGFIKEDVNGL
ncbi:MAG: CRISPR-associated helicase Cas3' [Eubacteriales bacterium]|nr:CRISPR-associated helicase Cas3' [Eubacteriales bacterium]